MAERRYYKITIIDADNGSPLFEGFYAGHGLGKIKEDASRALIASGFYRGEQLSVNHQTMKAYEFYDQLEAAERESGDAEQRRIKGVGHCWIVKPVAPEGDK